MRWILIAAMLGFTGCREDLADDFSRVDRFAKGNQLGDFPDVFIVRAGLAGKERIALVYAMAPDMEFCQEVAKAYNEKYPLSPLSCEYAN